MATGYSIQIVQLDNKARYIKQILMVFFTALLILFGSVSFAAEKSTKYQVVVGSDEKAYLLDTTTGFTWILTYRTLATGREPIAIPYKFITISPLNQKEFIVENAKTVSLPPNGDK